MRRGAHIRCRQCGGENTIIHRAHQTRVVVDEYVDWTCHQPPADFHCEACGHSGRVAQDVFVVATPQRSAS